MGNPHGLLLMNKLSEKMVCLLMNELSEKWKMKPERLIRISLE